LARHSSRSAQPPELHGFKVNRPRIDCPAPGKYHGAKPNTEIEARLDQQQLDVDASGFDSMVLSGLDSVEHIGVPTEQIRADGLGL